MNDAFQYLTGLGALKSWLTEHLPLFREINVLAPRAIVLTGLPGTGKRSVAKAIAASIGRQRVEFTSGQPLDPATVAVVENLDREHLRLVRRLAHPDESTPFVIAMMERPWELPAGLFRPDAIESIWHLDLPDMKERAELWDLAAKRRGFAHPDFDQVILARASHELTHGEIHAVFDRAMRISYPKEPGEKHLLEAMVDIRHFGSTKHEDLTRMTCQGLPMCQQREIHVKNPGTSGSGVPGRSIFFSWQFPPEVPATRNVDLASINKPQTVRRHGRETGPKPRERVGTEES